MHQSHINFFWIEAVGCVITFYSYSYKLNRTGKIVVGDK